MARRKRAERFTKRLSAEFAGAGETFRGFVSNVSETGLFIRSRQSFQEGSPLDIMITLPDGRVSSVRGVVRRAVTRELGHSAKNGMGIEITHMDENFADFLLGFGAFEGEENLQGNGRWMTVRRCPDCGAGNSCPAGRASAVTKCRKCGAPLPAVEGGGPEGEAPGWDVIIIPCAACGLRNSVDSGKLHLGPRCGGCGEPLPTG